MDVVKAIQNYVSKMIAESGRKRSSDMMVLLLDTETTAVISMATTQSHLLEKQIYLVDRVENQSRERMRHLRCLCFVRPSEQSVQCLVEELQSPRYGSYSLFFSNIIPKDALERLAEADQFEVVNTIQEFFADFLVINRELFSLNFKLAQTPVFGRRLDSWNTDAISLTRDKLMAVLLSLKKRPVIRYERNSTMGRELASELASRIHQESSLFDFRKLDTEPVVLILDRMNDPVTPLLIQWTYQAMVHEMIGIHNGRVDLSNINHLQSDLKEIVLNADQDPFFQKCMFMNFGDLGASIKEYVNQYQSSTKSNMSIESIADMKRFVEEYPEFQRLSGNVSKHVTLISELSRQVDRDRLLTISELEQSLACNDAHSADLKALQNMLSTSIPDYFKVKLVALYALRYEKHVGNALPALCVSLANSGIAPTEIRSIQTLLKYAGQGRRQEDLYGTESLFSRAKSGLKGLKGVENVYTQHAPLLTKTIEALIKGRLSDLQYPFVINTPSVREKPQDIIIFMVGGTTYEEARAVAQMNVSFQGIRLVLGGTTIHNSQSFLNDLQEAFSSS